MKVLHLGKFCPPTEGGIETFSYDLIEKLNSIGIKADLLCFGNQTINSRYRNFNYYACKMNMRLNSAPISLEFIKKFLDIEANYDIIHIHSPNPLAEILSIYSRRKVIIHWHSDIVKQKLLYSFYKPIQKKALQKAEKIIVTSPQYLNTSEQLKDYKQKATIVQLALNTKRLDINDESKNEIKKVLNIMNNKKIVLAIGRLVEYKGFEYLIKASKYLNDDLIVIIIGGGPLYYQLRKKINNEKLNDRVFLLGRVNNVSSYMKYCDLFCLPSISRNEAFGLVLVEALYFGKPLVTTNVEGSGMNYVNINDETGLIVPPKNSKALADAINKIFADENRYKKLKENAFKRFKEFDIDSVTDKIINIYNNI